MSQFYVTKRNGPDQFPGTHRALTPAGLKWAHEHKQMPPDLGDIEVRSDGVTTLDGHPVDGTGLLIHAVRDRTGREILEFSCPPGDDCKYWMNQFKAPLALQVAFTNNVENTYRQGQKYLAEHPPAVKL